MYFCFNRLGYEAEVGFTIILRHLCKKMAWMVCTPSHRFGIFLNRFNLLTNFKVQCFAEMRFSRYTTRCTVSNAWLTCNMRNTRFFSHHHGISVRDGDFWWISEIFMNIVNMSCAFVMWQFVTDVKSTCCWIACVWDMAEIV